jgi:hypothetical protein
MRRSPWLLFLAGLLLCACVDGRSQGRGGGGDDDDVFDDDDSAAGDDDTGDDDTGDDDTGDDDTGDDDTGDDDVGDDDSLGTDPCSDEARQLIYVIDHEYRLFSFHPWSQVFNLIGPINCPAGPSWPEWDPMGLSPATPFSMSIDRDARAWVLYSSGEVFRVSTQDASCTPTGFVPGQLGFKLFGMGFSSDAPGSDQDTLFISGGDFINDAFTGYTLDPNAANLGTIDITNMSVSLVGSLQGGEEYTPELTGNGDGELYGYYPALMSSATITGLNKQTGQRMASWSLPTSSGGVNAWAFAYWGGQFYVFLTTGGAANVYVFDPLTNSYDLILGNTGNVVVGAGVSTCAPVSAQ